MENITEMKEKEKRKKNLVLFNIPENKKEEASESIKEDQRKCDELFQDILGVKDAEIYQIIRLGRTKPSRTGDRPRPVLVEMNEVGVKWALVKKSKELKDNDNSAIKEVIITPDLTRKEREENDKLREELKKRRSEGGQWIIRKGRVVRLHSSRGDAAEDRE